MYLQNTKIVPRVESWPVLQGVATTPHLLAAGARTDTNASTAWALLQEKLILLDTNGRVRTAIVNGGSLPKGGAMSSCSSATPHGATRSGSVMLVAASSQELVTLSCDASTVACAITKRIVLESGHSNAVTTVACEGTTAWVAAAGAGCVFSVNLQTGTSRKHDAAIAHGNVTALAVTQGRVAVGTEAAVFHEFNASQGTFSRHTSVGDLIDAPPRALAFLGNDLW
eukprot:COSAG02_NODE_5375_length_4384_cov_28.351773_1_plen_225_part_10